MKKKPYQRQPGDFEVRVLKDSRIVLVGPDQELMDLAQGLCQPSEIPDPERINDESTSHAPGEDGPAE